MTKPTKEVESQDQRSEFEREKKSYFEVNDFESGLKAKSIYTDEIIMGWLKSTFDYAVNFGRDWQRERESRAWETHNEFLRGPYTDLQKECHSLRAQLAEAVKDGETYVNQALENRRIILEREKELAQLKEKMRLSKDEKAAIERFRECAVMQVDLRILPILARLKGTEHE